MAPFPSQHQDIDDASYKSENFVILGYCLEYYNDNPYITEFLERTYPPKEEIVALQETMEEEIAEAEISLDEKEQESEVQTEDIPPNDNNSLTLKLYNYPPCLPKEDECYVALGSLEISLFEESDACYTYDHDSPTSPKTQPNQKETEGRHEMGYGCL